MSEHAINPNDRLFLAAKTGGPYLVIAGDEVHGFQSYGAAEEFARSLPCKNMAGITIGRAVFKRDGTPYRMKTFPTPFADSSFERARREFGL
jgi:hypothetical protein